MINSDHLWGGLAAMAFGLIAAGCEAGATDAASGGRELDTLTSLALGDPLPGLTPAERQRFQDGKEDFTEVEDIVADGVGPVFNETSCVACHDGPVGGSNGRLETRFGGGATGQFDPLLNAGGSLMQDHGIGAIATLFPNEHVAALPTGCADATFAAEVVPAAANVVALRRTTPLFGLGLVDALAPGTLGELARQQARDTPESAGIVSLVTNPDNGKREEGRFGWKAQVSTLHVFAGDAYLNEMGVTSPSFPNESCPQGLCAALTCNPFPQLNNSGEDVDHFADFMALLAPPARGRRDAQVVGGERLFAEVGCATCHVATLQAGTSASAALSHRIFHPYSDFLLHDMGALGDGITQNDASGRLMRTAPLWGVRFQVATGLLHDGRAHSFAAAIAAHDGQAAASRAAFDARSNADRAAIIAFLGSL